MKIMFFLSFFLSSQNSILMDWVLVSDQKRQNKASNFNYFFYFFFPYFPRSLLGWGYLYVVVVVSGDSLFIKNGKISEQ